MRRFNPRKASFLGVNIALLALYLFAASFSWRIPEEDGAGLSPASAGSAMVWAGLALPVLLLSCLTNIVVARIVLKREQSDEISWTVVVVSLMWVVGIAIDFWRH
jgi:cytochrome c biogenesis protein CcdA